MPRRHIHVPGTAYRRNYCENNLELALESVIDGRLSFGQAAIRYSVPKTTIFRKYRGMNSDRLGKPPVFGKTEEKKLLML